MFLKVLNLINFRNIAKLNINFSCPINIFYGLNGQGKTNIVESIYLLSTTNSFRSNDFKEMITSNLDSSMVSGIIENKIGDFNVKIALNRNGKAIYYNNNLINKISDYVGSVSVICFAPNDVYLFQDSPSDRRRFLNKELTSLIPNYLKYLMDFEKILEQRNALLKRKVDEDLLEIINIKLIENSYYLYLKRKWFLKNVEEFSSKIYQLITSKSSKLKIEYKSFVIKDDENEYFNEACKIYQSHQDKDIEKGYTHFGIHKDDFKVYLNDLLIDSFASQGQQRLVSLCLKLACLELIKLIKKDEPILILDDAFSELDAKKKEKLLKYVSKKSQVFITCNDYKDIVSENENNNISLFMVSNGSVSERSNINGR